MEDNVLNELNEHLSKIKNDLEEMQKNPSSINQEKLVQMLDKVTNSLDNIDIIKITNNVD